MGRSCPSMPPFNVENFVFPLISPMDSPTLKGASRHKHGSKVNFVQDGSRFHAASDSHSGNCSEGSVIRCLRAKNPSRHNGGSPQSGFPGPGSLPNSSSGPSFLFLDVFVFRSHKDHAYRPPMYHCTRIAWSYARAPGLGSSTTLLT